MTKFSIATFNCENLIARFKFTANVNPNDAIIDGWLADKTKLRLTMKLPNDLLLWQSKKQKLI